MSEQNQNQNQGTYHGRSEEDLKRIFKEVFVEEIRQIFLICQESTATFSEAHRLEHDFVKAMLERERLRADFYRDIKKQVFGWGIMAIAGFLGNWLITHLHR